MATFEEKRRQKAAQKTIEESTALLLRTTRCPACQGPLLWHPEPSKPETGSLTTGCTLDQRAVMELAQAKDASIGGRAPAPKTNAPCEVCGDQRWGTGRDGKPAPCPVCNATGSDRRQGDALDVEVVRPGAPAEEATDEEFREHMSTTFHERPE